MYGEEGFGRQMKIGCQIGDGGHHSSWYFDQGKAGRMRSTSIRKGFASTKKKWWDWQLIRKLHIDIMTLHCCLLTQAFQLFLSECFFVSGNQLSTQQSREAGEKRWRREAVYFLTWREFTGGVKKSPAHPRLLLSQQHFPFGNTLLWHAGSVPVPPNV